MTTELIAEPGALRDLARALAGAPWVALDTEFLRTDTYYARLCLVQLACPGVVACVDTLALGADLAPLLEALGGAAPKVLHAARQDLEVLLPPEGSVPAPVFDTQIAAALCGFDEQIGYGALVRELLGVELAKQHTRTDWSKRPLDPAQLAYALDDVRYLGQLHELLSGRLQALGRTGWLLEECALLANPALYRPDPSEAWRRLGAGAMLSPRAQTLLRELAAARERFAQARNLPRGWVLKDTVLLEIARREPATLEALATIPELPAGAVRRWGEELLAIVRSAGTLPAQRWYEPPQRFTPEQQALLRQLSERVQALATRLGLRPPVLATRQDLVSLLLGRSDTKVLKGWRREVVGEELATLCATAGVPPLEPLPLSS